MTTVDSGRRVALLARPGAARDCVRAALLEVGAQLVAEEDPAQVEPQAIRDAAPQVLMIVLDSATEDALGRFDAVIGDPAIEVMFEEADVAVSREGWEAARWRRHLAAKLHRSDDVLPPIAAEEVPAIDILSMQIEELIAVDESGEEIGLVVNVPLDASSGSDFSVFDPVSAEREGAQEFVLGIDGLEFDPNAFDPGTRHATSFETTSFEASADALPPVAGSEFSASDFDPLLAELDAEMPERAPSAGGRDWDGDLVDGFDGSAAPSGSAGPVETPAATDTPRATFGELSLADDAAPVPAKTVRPAGQDLEDLERRISSLQLVDDTSPAEGVVLVMAGMGGPDAVRQFLGGLPATFPRAVLVRQRLDGARYDKLVAQMQRATELPVALAEPGRAVAAGTIYVVGDDVGLDSANGLRFTPGDRLLESIPASGSAVVLLSGSDPADVDRVAALSAQGAWLGAQAADGCYDPTAAEALAARGAVSDAPAELARQLARRWST